MDQLRQMQAFVAVVQAGSFVQAAERLDTSKAVVSRALAWLRRQMGAWTMEGFLAYGGDRSQNLAAG